MRNDSNAGCLIFVVAAVVIPLLLLLAYWRFNAVMDSSLPDWLKYFLLR